jgi:TM2 domain-containing membrane protein YozV
MKYMKNFRVFLLMAASLVFFTSAIPVNKASDPERMKIAVAAAEKAMADGKLTYSELKTIATDYKGEKLSIKEKVALKLFGKKIASKATSAPAAEGKSQLIALIICGLVGGLGIHRFYLGYTWQGIVQLLTLGGCGVWALIDFIRIITGGLQPKDSEYATTL